MKRLLVGLALFAVACGGTSPSAPTGAIGSGLAPQVTSTPADPSGSGPAVDPTPGGPSATAVVPQFTFSGPRNAQNCFTNVTEAMQWVLNVTDAGPRALRFIALAHQDETPGCEATAKNPRSRVEMTGVTNYTPHSSGQTTFTFRPEMYNCGRVQVDVSIFDAQGNEILILGTVINYNTTCEPPQIALVCSASPSNPSPPNPGDLLTFSVSNPVAGQVYTWSAPGATPASGTGTSFTTQYASPTLGTLYQITPSGPAGADVTPCTVQFANVGVALCQPSPTNPVPQPGQPWTGTFSVLNPLTGRTYTWSAASGTPPSGTGLTFAVTFPANAGTTTITHAVQLSDQFGPLFSGGCTVPLPPPPPPPSASCAPAATNPLPVAGQPWSGSFNVVNPQTGQTYAWSATGGTPASGTGLSFPVTFPANTGATAILYTVQLSSGGVPLPSTLCTVELPPPPPPPLSSCAPAATNPLPVVGQPWTGSFNVVNPQGGQTYTWGATGGSPSTGTGATFAVTYPANLTAAPVTYNVLVSAGGSPLPATLCTVTLPPTPAPICSPATLQTVLAGVPVPFSVSNAVPGVNYTWAIAPTGGTILSTGANGTTLSASFAGPVAPATTVNYAVTPSIPGGSTGTACQVQVPVPVASCAGTTGLFTDLIPLTLGAQVTVPPGQLANITLEVLDRATGIMTYLPYSFGPGTHNWTFNTACFVKVNMVCTGTGGGFLDRRDSTNVCPAP